MNKPILNLLMGHAGSGKSYFARHLAETKHWTRLNGDSMRMALFGSVEAIQAQDQSLRREGIFRAVDYAAEQVILSGQSVVYDANNNRREVRLEKEAMATRTGAIAVVVWVQVSKEQAILRTQERDEAKDQRQFTKEQATEVIERHIANTDEPGPEEKVIIINGTVPFEEQITAYDEQLENILDGLASRQEAKK
jgi:predicted kinase